MSSDLGGLGLPVALRMRLGPACSNTTAARNCEPLQLADTKHKYSRRLELAGAHVVLRRQSSVLPRRRSYLRQERVGKEICARKNRGHVVQRHAHEQAKPQLRGPFCAMNAMQACKST